MSKRRAKCTVRVDFHKPLRKAMEEKSLTEGDLAVQTGLSLYAVRLVLAGSHRATVRAMASVARILGFEIKLNFYKPSLLEKIAEVAE